jgi:hypothetical protein
VPAEILAGTEGVGNSESRFPSSACCLEARNSPLQNALGKCDRPHTAPKVNSQRTDTDTKCDT